MQCKRKTELACSAGGNCGFLRTSWITDMLHPHPKIKATACKRIYERMYIEVIFIVAKKERKT